jgi:hypothetical protein
MNFGVRFDRPDARVGPEAQHGFDGLAHVGANVDEVVERMPSEGLIDVVPLIRAAL